MKTSLKFHDTVNDSFKLNTYSLEDLKAALPYYEELKEKYDYETLGRGLLHEVHRFVSEIQKEINNRMDVRPYWNGFKLVDENGKVIPKSLMKGRWYHYNSEATTKGVEYIEFVEEYLSFSTRGVYAFFTESENNSDIYTDYFEKTHMRIYPGDVNWEKAMEMVKKTEARKAKRFSKR